MNADKTMTDESLHLLERTKTIMDAEMSLTRMLEKVEPWLKNAKVNPHQPRVRPIPTTMEEAKTILAVARSLANRTSAPAGWNPAAPITNFATPNPLPNQLRGGALAALQLERAKKAESDKKRTIQAEIEAEKQKKAKKEERPAAPQQHQHRSQYHRVAPSQQMHKPKPAVSMNLSDSSSEEEDEES